jgi:putative transposase
MSWRSTSVINQRRQMLRDYNSQLYSKTELAERYGVSRPTIDRWIARAIDEGHQGLNDRSHAVHTCPHRTDQQIEQVVIDVRREHPDWGPKMITGRLKRLSPEIVLPAESTIAAILKRNGLITDVVRRRRVRDRAEKPRVGTIDQPNQLWNIDYKGEALLGDGRYCYPLTVTDTFSRFLLVCTGFYSTGGHATKACLERAFREYGLPDAIRSDNGTPFRGVGLNGLSRLNIWWMKLGIHHIHTRPGCPQDNGQHERMHRTLKKATMLPTANTLEKQQRRFDAFRGDFNNERPHQGIGREVPASLYLRSERQMPARIAVAEYPAHYERRHVHGNGNIRFKNYQIFLSSALAGEDLGLVEIDNDIWSIYEYDQLIGRLDLRTGCVL